MTDLFRKGNMALTGIKLITYILVSFLLVRNLGAARLEIVAVLIVLLISNSFFRQEYMYGKFGATGPTYASFLMEILVILAIGFLPVQVGYYVYLFFVTVSECTIAFPPTHSIPVAVMVLFAMPVTVGLQSGEAVWTVIMDLAPAWMVSILFVYAMSYVVRIQIIEREKLARTNLELEDTYRKLLEHMRRAEELSVEKERVRMSREIHDTLAHTLTAVVVQMEAVKKRMSVDPVQAAQDIDKALGVTREGLSELKRTIKALRPQMMEGRSFVDALDRLVAEQSLLKVDLEVNLIRERADDPNSEVILFRLIQEAMTNAVRHGAAKNLWIRIGQEGDNLLLSVKDDGKGTAVIRRGFGLTGIQERIEKAGGSVRFQSQIDKGFEIDVQIPWVKEDSV